MARPIPRGRAALAVASIAPGLAYELAELSRGEEGWPFTRWVLLLPRWVIALVLTAAYVVLWHHFINHD